MILDFPLLGRPLTARLRTPALARWLDERWNFEEHDLPPVPYRIDLVESELRPGDLPPAEGEPIRVPLPGLELTWRNDGTWWQTETGAESGRSAGRHPTGLAARFAPGRAEIFTWGEPPPTHFAALYLALSEALRASGLIPLHAAVVVRDGEAIALTARSGTGKTTTLLRLLAAGWTPLAEDLAWLDPDSLKLYGWDRGIRLWQETIDRFLPHLADAPWTTDPDGKRFLGYRDLAPLNRAGAQVEGAAPSSSRVSSARLTRIVRLERGARSTEGASTLPGSTATRPGAAVTRQMDLLSETLLAAEPTPLLPHDAVRTLWEATGVPLLPATRSGLTARIPGLLRRVEFSRLVLGEL